MINLTINGHNIQTNEGKTVLEAALENGIVIPTLCYHPDLTPYGGCRLCNIELKGARTPLSSCTLPAAEGMVVETETPDLVEERRAILKMLLSNYTDHEYEPHHQKDNELMKWADFYQIDAPSIIKKNQPVYAIDSDPNPVVWVDMNKCILCTRCIRACAEIQGRYVWGLERRGSQVSVVPGAGTTMLASRCESCGACVAYCPTGALDNKLSIDAGEPEHSVTTTCPYCGVGCTFALQVKDNTITGVRSIPEAPVNGMHLCVKGRYGYQFVNHPDRLTRPKVRDYILAGTEKSRAKNQHEWIEVDWDTALDIVSSRLVKTKNESGSDSLGFLCSAKCTNEENYLVNKLSRQLAGTNNIDHCARLCHASTVAGLAMCFGSGAMTNTISDISEQAESIFIIGSNITEQHPVFGAKVRQTVSRRGVKLIVADPRKIDITEFATLHLRQKPGTDVALINGLMHIIIANNWHDIEFIEQRTENFAEVRQVIEKYHPKLVSDITGIPQNKLYQAAEIMAQNHPLAVFWAMGITQHTTGVLNVLSLGNLQMLLGNMGIAGGGVNPLRGQNNVQGACDLGGLPNVFPGYQPVTSDEVRKKYHDAWMLKNAQGDEVEFLSPRPGLTVTEMIPQANEGHIKALYILAENPISSDPDSNHVRESLETCELVVLQEIFPTETSAYADILLPGISFAEKRGTVTNTERRIQMVREAINPPGEARDDWSIIQDIANRIIALEHSQPYGTRAGWNYNSPAEIMDEIAALTPIYAGVSHDRLELGENLHWPVKNYEHPGTPILHVGSFSRGKGKFHVTEHLDAAELPDPEYPFLLTTGRVLYHWHGGEMTRRSQGLFDIYPETLVEVNPEDAQKLGLHHHEMAKIISRRGEMSAKVFVTERVSAGVIFANFHFPGEHNVNNLTIAALDPIAKIPEYKVCAVKISSCL